MVTYAVLVGIIAAIAAWGFHLLIGFVHNLLFLGSFSSLYDSNLHVSVNPWGWGIIFVPVLGAVFVAWLVKNFAPEAKGHGVPEVMQAIHNKEGLIRPRVAIVKSLASAISIGTGASVGREGPIVQVGSAFGSMLGQIFPMNAENRSLLVAAGAGAGIAATFNVPLGGLIFAMELLMRRITVHSMLIVSTATVTATFIGRAIIGQYPSFNFPDLQTSLPEMVSLQTMLLLVALAVIGGLISAGFIRALYWAEDKFDELHDSYYLKHILGMFCVGIMLYLMIEFTGKYYVQGTGDATLADILTHVLSDTKFLLLLCVLKLLSTCLSLGSGASGGVFSPSLFMGATLGAAFACITDWSIANPTAEILLFAAAGMVAMVAGTTGAILTAVVILLEMTAAYGLILPLMIVSAVAAVTRHWFVAETIYTMKLTRRGDIVPQGLQSIVENANNKRKED